MRIVSHSTWTQILSSGVEEWRTREGWSREEVCAKFVEAFRTTEAPNAWNIEFSSHHNGFQRQKNDADKIMRWLDDVKKDNNLLTMNFARVIMASFPIDIRMKCAAKMLCSMGIAVGMMDECSEEELHLSHIFEAQINLTQGLQAVTIACQDLTPENLERAELELSRGVAKANILRRVVAGLKSRATKAKDALKNIRHPKARV